MVVVSNASVMAEHGRGQTSPEALEDPGGGAASQVLAIEDLHVKVEDHEILRGVDLVVGPGELHALMGPNGSGKSTLANVHRRQSRLPGRARADPVAGRGRSRPGRPTSGPRPGCSLPSSIPRRSPASRCPVPPPGRVRPPGMDISVLEVRVRMMEWMERLDMDPAFASRYLNEGFSGGEKKRNEILQMAMLEPDVAILDETDSGLDVDALRIVARGIEYRAPRPPGARDRARDALPPDPRGAATRPGARDASPGASSRAAGPELAERLEPRRLRGAAP